MAIMSLTPICVSTQSEGNTAIVTSINALKQDYEDYQNAQNVPSSKRVESHLTEIEPYLKQLFDDRPSVEESAIVLKHLSSIFSTFSLLIAHPAPLSIVETIVDIILPHSENILALIRAVPLTSLVSECLFVLSSCLQCDPVLIFGFDSIGYSQTMMYLMDNCNSHSLLSNHTHSILTLCAALSRKSYDCYKVFARHLTVEGGQDVFEVHLLSLGEHIRGNSRAFLDKHRGVNILTRERIGVKHKKKVFPR
ncbi:hypothetical protein BLNAU_11283 [Blattamonas nauphoetae]|uniref:Uncharacterized protein n=1 Tax=Blattamonas nauphoetae TaxID=2049346 RepID=A0ABQ9XSJ7_9EUKA|nr:hypothetical protein BLNAU_11283 [Blattamonas nauphoetae]